MTHKHIFPEEAFPAYSFFFNDTDMNIPPNMRKFKFYKFIILIKY